MTYNPPFEATEEFKIMSKMSIFLYFCKGSEIAPKNLIMAKRNLVGNLPSSTVIHIVIVNFKIHRN